MENDYKKLTHRWKTRSSTLLQFRAKLYCSFLSPGDISSINWSLCSFAQLVAEELGGKCMLSSRLLFYFKVGSTLLQKEQKVWWPCGWWWVVSAGQIVKHGKVAAMRNPSDSFYIQILFQIIYSLIHRPEHLRLVLNCCFELVEVGSKIDWAGWELFQIFSDKYLGFLSNLMWRDSSVIITQEICHV